MSTEKHAPEGRARAWIEVRSSALRHNYRTVRKAVEEAADESPPAMIPMVKADAYGLGVGPAVAALEQEGPWGFGVATVEEGLELRGLGVERPVVVFAPVPPGAVEAAVEGDLILAISDLDTLVRVQAAARGQGREATVHLEVDTGMGRAGLDWRRSGEWGPRVRELARDPLRIGGVFTHFHSADQGEADGLNLQAERFRDALETLALPEPGMVHLCNSAAALRRPSLGRGGVRPGIVLYGGRAGVGLPEPEAVASVRARIALVREVPPGTTVGYGATYAARGWERWATLGIGYGDGLPRILGNRGHALVRGRRVPIVGRISMDMTVVDITSLNEVSKGEVATLLGRDGDEEVSVEEMARLADTINYEILTGFTPRLPRIWLEDGAARGSPETKDSV